MTLEQKFEEHLKKMHSTVRHETGYQTSGLHFMAGLNGAVHAAKSMLKDAETIHDGLTRLAEYGRLDLSLEAAVIEPPWRDLFTTKELQIAVNKLERLRYPVGAEIIEYIKKREQ